MRPRELFEILIRENADMLGVYLRGAVDDPGLADDLFQETVLAAWRGLERYDRARPFGAWLRGIAAKQVLAARRRGARGLVLTGAEELEALDARCGALERVAGDTLDERLEPLRACLGGLSGEDRAALDARYSEGLRGTPLAERLGATLEGARKRVQRARARLAACLDRRLAEGTQA